VTEESRQDEFVVDDWFAVDYDRTQFPGEMRSLSGDD